MEQAEHKIQGREDGERFEACVEGHEMEHGIDGIHDCEDNKGRQSEKQRRAVWVSALPGKPETVKIDGINKDENRKEYRRAELDALQSASFHHQGSSKNGEPDDGDARDNLLPSAFDNLPYNEIP